MPATAPSYALHVERGPDWLLVRVKCADPMDLDAVSLAEDIWSLLEQHFTYRLVLELDQVSVLTSHLIAQLLQLHRRLEQRDGVIASAAFRRTIAICCTPAASMTNCRRIKTVRKRSRAKRTRDDRVDYAQQTSNSLAISCTPSTWRMASWAICFWK